MAHAILDVSVGKLLNISNGRVDGSDVFAILSHKGSMIFVSDNISDVKRLVDGVEICIDNIWLAVAADISISDLRCVELAAPFHSWLK